MDDPHAADIHVRTSDPAVARALEARIEELVRAHLSSAPDLWRDLVAGRVRVC